MRIDDEGVASVISIDEETYGCARLLKYVNRLTFGRACSMGRGGFLCDSERNTSIVCVLIECTAVTVVSFSFMLLSRYYTGA